VLAATGVEAAQWHKAISQLLEAGKVRQQGLKKGAKYCAVA
jgi:hypothetical protein